MDNAMRGQAIDLIIGIVLASFVGLGVLMLLWDKASALWHAGRSWVSSQWNDALDRALEEKARRDAGVRNFEDDGMEDEGGGAGSVGDRAGSRAGSGAPVLEPQFQQFREPVLKIEDVIDFLSKHKLTDEEAIDILAVLHRESGHLLSANKVRDTVGGADAVVKSRVANLRPKPPARRPAGTLRRPQNGWQ
jgi:hypothetical protein